MAWECRRATALLNDLLATEQGAAEFRTLSERNASPKEIVEAIAARCDLDTADNVRDEFRDLPRSLLSTWLISWRLAADCGQSFEIISEPAPRPLEYAKAGRVAYRIEHDNEGVRMYVSHVHGHHAEWFKPELEAAAAV